MSHAITSRWASVIMPCRLKIQRITAAAAAMKATPEKIAPATKAKGSSGSCQPGSTAPANITAAPVCSENTSSTPVTATVR